MAISLFDVTVGSYLQILGGVQGFMEKGKTHCLAQGIDLNDIVETRLYPDMLPFRFQIVSVAHHSLGAIKGMQSGLFTPPSGMESLGYEALQSLVADTLSELGDLDASAIQSLEGGELIFKLGDMEIPFTTEDFALSFSLPNLYFHATTAYDILRTKGVPLGKRDYTGKLKVKRN